MAENEVVVQVRLDTLDLRRQIADLVLVTRSENEPTPIHDRLVAEREFGLPWWDQPGLPAAALRRIAIRNQRGETQEEELRRQSWARLREHMGRVNTPIDHGTNDNRPTPTEGTR